MVSGKLEGTKEVRYLKCRICGIVITSETVKYPPCVSAQEGVHEFHPYIATQDVKSVMPEGQGKRDIKRPRHDLIPVEFLDELASIFEEGFEKYGDSWKRGGTDFLTDCLNHASNHLHLYMNGDTSENQLAKVAWNVLAVRWHDLKSGGVKR